MALLSKSTAIDNALTWPLQSCTFGLFRHSETATLYYDRATKSIGVVNKYRSTTYDLVRSSDGEVLYAEIGNLRAYATGEWSSKVSLLFENRQIDLVFASFKVAKNFKDHLDKLAVLVLGCQEYEPPHQLFKETDFDMVKHNFVGKAVPPGQNPAPDSVDWKTLRKTGQCSDFTIKVGNRKIPVHRVKICQDNSYFPATCNGNWKEGDERMHDFPESGVTVEAILDELYGVYNSTIGSVFMDFALLPNKQKAAYMCKLVDLFIACDKYLLDKIKRKAAEAILDRIWFVKDPVVIIDVAASLHSHDLSQDYKLREALLEHLQVRMPAIIEDDAAWNAFLNDKVLARTYYKYDYRHDIKHWKRTAGKDISGPGSNVWFSMSVEPYQRRIRHNT